MDDSGRAATGVISCVVDQDPRFHFEALRWYAALNRIAGVDASDLIVHTVGSDESAQLDYLRHRGVCVRPVEQFDKRHLHCNKISGALALAASTVEGLAVLTDSDVVFLEDPRAVAVSPQGIASRIVLWPVPTVEVLTVIFEQANLELPPLVPLDWPIGEFSVAGNGNGGVYLVPGIVLPQVTKAWAEWARWLLDRIYLFGQVRRLGLDQVAMAMALTSEGLGWAQLDKRWNFATDSFWRNDPDLSPPAGLHYHRAVEPSGELTLTGVPMVDASDRRRERRDPSGVAGIRSVRRRCHLITGAGGAATAEQIPVQIPVRGCSRSHPETPGRWEQDRRRSRRWRACRR